MSTKWEGVRTNTLLMILGDLARANEDVSEGAMEPYEWQLDREALIREIDKHGEYLKKPQADVTDMQFEKN